jgi:hypothetical protein
MGARPGIKCAEAFRGLARTFIYLAAFAVYALQLTAAPGYYWRALPVGQPPTAQLLTLFCQSCGTSTTVGEDIPLVAVLRDTLGDQDVSTSKVTAVWLLSYSHPTLGQRTLAAIPFFYWTLSDGSSNVKAKDTSPLLDLSEPQRPAVNNVERQILQWTALDTIDTPVRASSRAYRTNEVDHERLHLEEANSYLLHAPVGSDPDELTAAERDFVMASLELRKKLLGGFVSSSEVASLGREADFEQQRVRTRNWELLRQCAEKTGLIFEPVTLSGSDQQYGMLWYRARATEEPSGETLSTIWKLLGIKNPYADERLANWKGFTATRLVDGSDIKLIPLGLYSLTYPRQPLLLVDFRDGLNLRRNDITQKSIDEITSGVVGLSHFTNWYYFAASDIFNFIQGRRGKTNNRDERLDSYSEFRVSLALDHDLEPGLRQEIVRRAESIPSNPLESSPANEMAAALKRYSLLEVEARGDNSRLGKRIENQRREELANYRASAERQGFDIALHSITLGGYTHRAKREDDLALLSVYRRAEYNLEFLDKLVAAGTPPEVAYQEWRIRGSVSDLAGLLPEIQSPQMREHARLTLDKLSKISADDTLRADCERVFDKLRNGSDVSPLSVPGILAEPSVAPLPEPFR